ncbi:MAG TPA: alpha/beta hydrolase [Acidimicrobiales bacterium]|nr:alpha/beta hydrolase [Acidimicrobiales bacterium]
MASFWNALMQCEPRLYRTEVNGVETRVLEAGPAGSGPGEETVVLIHGASGHLESFIRTLPYLAPDRRTIAFDLPWHGYAGFPDRPYDVVDHAEYLAALAEKLGAEKVSLVGQSLGGAIAARATVNELLDVQRLVLIGSSGVANESKPDGPNTMKAALTSRSFEVVKARLEYAMACRGPEMDELVECRYLAYQRGEWEPRVEAFTYHETPEGRRRAVLEESEWRGITCPTLLLWGADDKVVPPSAGRRLAQLIERSELKIIPGCGHNPQFELADEVNPVLRGFLGEQKLAPAARDEA